MTVIDRHETELYDAAPGRFIDHPPRRNLDHWDEICRRRRCVALGGVDAHQVGIRIRGRVPIRLMAYRRSFINSAVLPDGSVVVVGGQAYARAFTDTGAAMPPEFDLRSVSTANGYAYIVPATGHILYTLKTAPQRPSDWTPAYAPELAKGMGAFSIALRKDGRRGR